MIWWMSEPSRSHFNVDSLGNDLLLISVSLVTIVPGIVFLALGGIKPNVEFQGGYQVEIATSPGLTANS